MSPLSFPLRSVFLALPLVGEALREFQRLQRSLLPWSDILSFQNPDSPHLTLMFWPEVSSLEYDGIAEQTCKIASRHMAFSLRANGIGTFGSRGRDAVLFLEVSFSDELARIKKSCPWTDGKPFHPHITLARIRHPERFSVEKKNIVKALGSPEFGIALGMLRLYAIVDGKAQTALASFPFTER